MSAQNTTALTASRHPEPMQIETDDLSRPAVHALLEEHLRDMRAWSPPESVHALDLDRLRAPGVTFWTAWDGADLLGCAALKELTPTHGEVKSMRTPSARRGRGAGRALLAQVIATARARGYDRLSLETGAQPPFEPARRLYASAGFVACGPFGGYRADPNSVFMTARLPPSPTEPTMHDAAAPVSFPQVTLYTDIDGRARFRDEAVPLTEGSPASRLSALQPSGGYQFRRSPVGFESDFHCTGDAQWLFVLAGRMEIGLQDGSWRSFGPGDHFYSADLLPDGAVFDPALHGHRSRQAGPEPLVTLFVRDRPGHG